MRSKVQCNVVADFETTTTKEDCRVWAWATCPIKGSPTDNDVTIGTDLDSFMEHISITSGTIYFHNLKFDGMFILDWLLNNKFRHTLTVARRNQFQTLISKDNKFYSITIQFKNGSRVELRDSMKKIPMSVSKAAKAYELGLSKLVIDYHEARPIGHILTDDEREYISADVKIIAAILFLQQLEGMVKLTVGADSLAEYKQTMGSMFAKLFPILDLETDAEIRRAYRGGWTFRDERYAKQVVGPGSVYDVNSLYPSVMYDRQLPYGMPLKFDSVPDLPEEYDLFIVTITFTAKLKKNHLPCIQLRNHSVFVSTEYLKEIPEPETVTLTNIDLALWQDHYHLNILTWEGGYYFRASKGMFTDYIDKWMEVKANSKGGLREIAKLHLNSLYGKFATNPNVTSRYPVLEDGVVKLNTAAEEFRNPVYTAMGVFITAYARDVTIRAAQLNYDTFLYADTDSLHLNTLDPPKGVSVHKADLGAWKKEYEFDYGIFWRAKAYCERVPTRANAMGGTHYETHIAGLPVNVASGLTIGDFQPNAVFGGKLLPTTVKGGIILSSVEFQLKS